MGKFSLNVYEPLKLGQGYINDISTYVKQWRRSTTLFGGPWRGTFRLYGPQDILEDWFYNGLGRHIEEWTDGLLTWSGFVWEVDYVQPATFTWYSNNSRGRRQRITLESMVNKVRSIYTDPSTAPPTTGETAWQSDAQSQAYYGTKQEVLYETLDATAALSRAQDFLANNANPFQEIVGIENNATEAFVEVTVAGYVNTAQWLFVTTDNGNLDDIGDWIEAIIDTDIDNTYLSKGAITLNLADIYRYLPNYRRAWEVLEDLVTLRGPSDERYVIEITPSRVINIKEWDRQPIGYFFNGRFTDLGYNDMEQTPQHIKPGVYRSLGFGDPTFSFASYEDSLLLAPTDFILETVEIREGGLIVPRLGLFDQEESIRSFVFKQEDLPIDWWESQGLEYPT